MNKEPFITPEDYFDNLPAKIQSRCLVKIENNNRHVYLKIASYAAILISIFAMLFLYNYQNSDFRKFQTKNTDTYMDDVMLIADIQGIEEDDIIEFLTANNTDDYGGDQQEEIIDYVNNNTDNYLDLLELLN